MAQRSRPFGWREALARETKGIPIEGAQRLIREIRKCLHPDDDNCLIWTGRIDRESDYPIIQIDGETYDVRDALWREHYGQGVQHTEVIIMLCGTARCVEPEHGRAENAVRDCIQCGIEFRCWHPRKNQHCKECSRKARK